MLPAAVLPPHGHHPNAVIAALPLPCCHCSAVTTAALPTPTATLPAAAALPPTHCHRTDERPKE
jgi:hypothetical protein